MKYVRLATLVAIAAAPALALADPQYTITDLGTLAPNAYSQTFGVSSNGAYIVGRAIGDSSAWPAFVWNASGGMTAQGALSGYNYAWGYAVNDSGVAVGVSALTGTGGSPVPTIWKNGVASQLVMPGGQLYGRAFAINDAGIAVGSVGSGNAEIATIYDTNTGKTRMVTAITPQGSYMQTAYAVSNNGIVVGTGVDGSGRNVMVSFDSNAGVLTQLEVPAYDGADNSSLAFDISDNGQYIVGSSGNRGQAVIWSAATGALVATLPSISSGGSLKSVNDSGWAVGSSGGVYSNPFLYADGSTYLISDIIVNESGWNFDTTTSASASGISNNGVIVGTAQFNGVEHAYMLTPVPEPASYALMLAGLAGVGVIARRRQARATA